MTWVLRLWREASGDINSLDKPVRLRAQEQLRRLCVHPKTNHALSGALAGCYSVEVARRYRIVFRLILGSGELQVIAVGKRENLEVYRIAAERVANYALEAEQHDDPENRTAEPN